MKNRQSLTNSRNARLKQTIKSAQQIEHIATSLMNCIDLDLDRSTVQLQSLRDCSENLLQCVHEFSAYNTALETK